MIDRFAPLTSALCALAATSLLTASPALGLEPKESDRVDSAEFFDLAHSDSRDGTTAYMGIEECRSAVANEMAIVAQFTTIFDIEAAEDDGLGAPFFEGAYTFDVSRGSGTSPDCASGSECAELSSSDYTLSSMNAELIVDFRDLTGLSNPDDCETNGVDREYFIRLRINDGGSADRADLRVVLDTLRPDPPSDFSAVATEDAIRVSWNAGGSGDIGGYRIVYSSNEFSSGELPEDILEADDQASTGRFTTTSSSMSGDISTSLEPDMTVWIGLATLDETGNASAIAGPKSYVVLDTVDFWEDYKQRGGAEQGGYACAAAAEPRAPGSAPPWALGALALGAVALRRRRR